jgi:hypothetical protein
VPKNIYSSRPNTQDKSSSLFTGGKFNLQENKKQTPTTDSIDSLPLKSDSKNDSRLLGLSDSQIKRNLLSKSQYKKFTNESVRKKAKAKEGAHSVSNTKMANSSVRNGPPLKSSSKVTSTSSRLEAKSARVGAKNSKSGEEGLIGR